MNKLKKSKLFLMVGVSGSGKSTWIEEHKNLFKGLTSIISRDKIRFSLIKENEEYFSKENEVWKEYVKQAIISLNTCKNTILDATHLNETSRSKILRALKDYLTNIEINAIVINTPFQIAIKQNDKREGRAKVPFSAIHRMSLQMTIPTFEEGFDNIYMVYPNKPYKIITKEVIK